MSAHPAQFHPRIIEAIARELDVELGGPLGDRPTIMDPFAGPGVMLGAMCDDLGLRFDGCDIEAWEDPTPDPRVRLADATNPASYPDDDFLVVTSPSYANGINDHHEPQEDSRRFTYRVALGRPLDPNNSGRYSIRGGRKSWLTYWRINAEAVQVWANRGADAIVNVKAFVHDGQVVDLPMAWEVLLVGAGYHIAKRVEVPTPGLRLGANSDARVDHEVLLVARRGLT